MTKFIEITLEGQVDRYKLIDITVDDFIDSMIIPQKRLNNLSNLKEISEQDYEQHRKFELDLNIEDKFQVQHYVFKHPSKEVRNEWNRFIRQLRRAEKLDIL